MDTPLLYGIAVVPAIVGLVQVVKDLGVPSNAAPLAAVLFGLAAGFAQYYAQHLPWIPAAVTGIALGLSAVGLYSGGKIVAQNVSFSGKDPNSDGDAMHLPTNFSAFVKTPAPAENPKNATDRT